MSRTCGWALPDAGMGGDVALGEQVQLACLPPLLRPTDRGALCTGRGRRPRYTGGEGGETGGGAAGRPREGLARVWAALAAGGAQRISRGGAGV